METEAEILDKQIAINEFQYKGCDCQLYKSNYRVCVECGKLEKIQKRGDEVSEIKKIQLCEECGDATGRCEDDTIQHPNTGIIVCEVCYDSAMRNEVY